MLLAKRTKEEARDWIAQLNQMAANEVDRAVLKRARDSQRRAWPVDILGGRCRGATELREDILATEVFSGPPELRLIVSNPPKDTRKEEIAA